MMVTTIIEWDMGHRIPNHKSVCKNLHGHRYKLEINVEGGFIRKARSSSESMIIDFGDVKDIARRVIRDPCDHAFMYWEKDSDMSKFFTTHKTYKHVSVPFIPTAEEIARWIFATLDSQFKDTFGTGLALHSVTVWETPTSKAFYSRKDATHGKKR